MKIAALVSGGVDSSVVVHLLKEAGYDPTLFYIRIGMEDKDKTLHCHSEEDIEIVSYTARKYGCRLEVVSLHDEYWKYVMGYTLDSIKRGFTPNPDVMCNKYIKFGFFEQYWGKDFDKIATGHYASIVEQNGITYLGTAIDPVKDQTDFLSQLNTLQVSKLMFPLGGLMKSEVRAIAENAGLPSAKRKDSQGICFLGNINYNEFIRNYLGEKEGDIIELETGKKLGKHKGYWFHTIGQRKGLGLSGGPWFVIRKEIIFICRTDSIPTRNTAQSSILRDSVSSRAILWATYPNRPASRSKTGIPPNLPEAHYNVPEKRKFVSYRTAAYKVSHRDNSV